MMPLLMIRTADYHNRLLKFVQRWKDVSHSFYNRQEWSKTTSTKQHQHLMQMSKLQNLQRNVNMGGHNFPKSQFPVIAILPTARLLSKHVR